MDSKMSFSCLRIREIKLILILSEKLNLFLENHWILKQREHFDKSVRQNSNI